MKNLRLLNKDSEIFISSNMKITVPKFYIGVIFKKNISLIIW